MQFIAKAGKVYNFRKSIQALETAIMLRRDATVETRFYDMKVVTIMYDSERHELTLVGPLPGGFNTRAYSTRITIGTDDIMDVVLHLNEFNEEDLRENESVGGTVQAAETNWSDPFGW